MNILNEMVNVFEADEEDNKGKANIVGTYEKGGQTMLKHGPQNDESGEIEGGEKEKEKEKGTNVLIQRFSIGLTASVHIPLTIVPGNLTNDELLKIT